jgi:hypothetical protein
MADYTTFEQISSRLGDQLRPEDAAFIEGKITAASRAIDQWCGQAFAPDTAATARTYRRLGESCCKTDPFWTTTDLVIATDHGDDGTYATPWAVADYALERFGGDMADVLGAPYDTIVAIARAFPSTRRPRAVRVTAKWGWAAVPTVVAEAAEIVTLDLWARKDTPLGVTQTTVDFAGLRVGRDVMAQAGSLLQPLRRMDRVLGSA